MTARTGAKSCAQSALRAMRVGAHDATSGQADEGERVAPVDAQENPTKTRVSAGPAFANSRFSNDMQSSATDAANARSRKAFVASSLRGFERLADDESATKKCKKCKP